MFWFIVLLLVVGAGFYFYQKMMAIESEIRAEQQAGNEHVSPVQESKKGPETPANISETASVLNIKSSSDAIIPEQTATEEAIISAVTKEPGMKQTDLYPLFEDLGKKQLQKKIKNMSDSGVLRREKQGSSYLLYLD